MDGGTAGTLAKGIRRRGYMAGTGPGVPGVDTSNPGNTMKAPDKKLEAQRCGTCHYFRAGRCQRFPPQVVALGAFQSNSGQPVVNPVGWCGEYKPKQNNGNL